METSRDTSELARHGEERQRDSPARPPHLDEGASSSSSALDLPNADTLAEETPPEQGTSPPLQTGAILPAQGGPPQARGRPPPAAPEEDSLLYILRTSDPARFEIMDRIPPAPTLPPKKLFFVWEECIQSHRSPNGQYG